MEPLGAGLYERDSLDQSVDELVQIVEDHGQATCERMLAAHMIHEQLMLERHRCWTQNGWQQLLDSQSFLGGVLDLLVEADRLQSVPVKLLWSLAAMPEAVVTLKDLGVVQVLLGILRAAEDPLLVGACLTLLARLAKDATVVRELGGQGASAGLLLRLLWLWHRDPGCMPPLLQLFEAALHSAACHQAVLAAELHPGKAGTVCKDRPLAEGQSQPFRVHTLLLWAADAATSKSNDTRSEVGHRAARLAKEWSAVAASLGVV